MKGITKYYIGLIVVGAFVLIMLVVVLLQGASARQDNQLYRQANKVADKLNSYVDKNSKVPESLADAEITDVPGGITYTKKATDMYKFCVTYKSASKGFDMSDPARTLSDRAAEQYYGGGSADSYGSLSGESDYLDTALYLDANHKAGKNCQTIKLYINTLDSFGSDGTSSCHYDASSDTALNDYYDCLDKTQSSDDTLRATSPAFTN